MPHRNCSHAVSRTTLGISRSRRNRNNETPLDRQQTRLLWPFLPFVTGQGVPPTLPQPSAWKQASLVVTAAAGPQAVPWEGAAGALPTACSWPAVTARGASRSQEGDVGYSDPLITLLCLQIKGTWCHSKITFLLLAKYIFPLSICWAQQ